MPFNLIRAIKSTHRYPIKRVLHCIGLPLYVIGFALVVGYFTVLHTNPITGIILWLIAIGLVCS
jgi:hypothetical protein